MIVALGLGWWLDHRIWVAAYSNQANESKIWEARANHKVQLAEQAPHSRLLFVGSDVGFPWRGFRLLIKEPNVGNSMLSLTLMLWWVVQLIVHAR